MVKATNDKAQIEKVKAAIRDLSRKQLKIGWFDTAKYEDGTPVAYVATIHEFGYPGGSIPARPFMRPTISDKTGEWRKILSKGSKAVVRGELEYGQMLYQFGASAVGDIQETISSITSPPLSNITLLLRQRRKSGESITGRTVGNAAIASRFLPESGVASALNVSDKPLVDTNYMLSSISAKVEDV